MPRKTLSLFVMAVFLTLSVHANAALDELFFGVGARFTWMNHKKPILVYSGGYNEGFDPGVKLDEYGGPNLGSAFHLGLTSQFVIHLGFDFGYFSHKIYPFPAPEAGTETEQDLGVMEVKSHFFTLGFMLGTKIYFWDPIPGEAVGYLDFAVGKYFAMAGNNHKLKDIMEPEEQDLVDNETLMVGKLASPFLFQVCFGAEFFATNAFSVGADIIGIRFSYSKADGGAAPGMHIQDAKWSGEQSILNFYLFSAVTMTFNLTAENEDEYEEDEVDQEEWGQQPAPAPVPGPMVAPMPGPMDGSMPDGSMPPDDGSGAWGGGWEQAPPPEPVPMVSPEPLPEPTKKKKKSRRKKKKNKKKPSSSWGAPAPQAVPPPPPPGY